jgi:hypothetical protein
MHAVSALSPALISPQRTRGTRCSKELKKPGGGFFMIFSVTSVFSVVQMLKILLMNAGQGPAFRQPVPGARMPEPD